MNCTMMKKRGDIFTADIQHLIPVAVKIKISEDANVASTSMQRLDVASTLRRRCLNVMCPQGKTLYRRCKKSQVSAG